MRAKHMACSPLTVALLGALTGCLEVVPDATPADAQLTDAQLTDAQLTDAGLTDAQLTDVGAPDAEIPAPTCAVVWAPPPGAPASDRPGPEHQVNQPVVADLNCDGYDDLLLPLATAASVEIWYGGPWALGGRGGALATGLRATERPHRVLVDDLDPSSPGPELLMLIEEIGAPSQWAIVGAHNNGDGTFSRVGRRDLTNALGEVDPRDLHLTVAELNGAPPAEIVTGTELSVVPMFNLIWSDGEAGFAQADVGAPLTLAEISEGVIGEVYGLIPVPGLQGREALITVQPSLLSRYAISTEEQDALLMEGALGLDGLNSTVTSGALGDVNGDGQPEVITVGSRGEADIWATTPGRDLEGATWQSYILEDLSTDLDDGRLDALEVGDLYGDTALDAVILDLPSLNDPGVLDAGASVRLYTLRDLLLQAPSLAGEPGALIPVERRPPIQLPAGVPYIFARMGRFNGATVEVVVLSPEGQPVCYAPASAEGGDLAPCSAR